VTFSGTSIAAALVTGLIALVKQYNPNFTYTEIINIFKNASIELKDCPKNSQGFGTLNIINIFNQLNAYPKKQILRPYQELIKRSLIISVKFFLIMIIIYLIFYFFNIIQMIFNLIL
jgi:subtilisin family serine protease